MAPHLLPLNSPSFFIYLIFRVFFLFFATHGQHVKRPLFKVKLATQLPLKFTAYTKNAKQGQFIYDTTC